MDLRPGVIVPLITPLREDESLDHEGLERLVEHVITGGVSGIFVLGSSGEGPALPADIQEEVVRAVSGQARGRVPVLVGAFAVGTRQTIALARRLSAAGGDAIVLVAPYYFAQTQAELISHFTAIAACLDVPVVLYNIPPMVKTIIEPETIIELAAQPGITAVKDSFGDMTRFQRVLAARSRHPGFGVYQGAEALAAVSVVRGADGVVLGLANVAPALCSELYAAAAANDLSRAWQLQSRLMTLWQLHTHGQWLPCLKAATSALGLCGRTTSAPFAPLDGEAIEAIRRDMAAAGILEG